MNRRDFLLTAGSAGTTVAFGSIARASEAVATDTAARLFQFVRTDVFTSQPLLGNPLDVFLDARGLSDAEMLSITRETFLNEATFVIPRDAATEREHGIRVRIFQRGGEVPFAGHPTLGTATVLRELQLASNATKKSPTAELSEIILDLNIGKVPITFKNDNAGRAFGEMQQVPPKFGTVHDRKLVAQLHNLSAEDIAEDGPIQTVSTGLPFAIVPLKRLSSLQFLQINAEKMTSYVAQQEPNFSFYYVTRETADQEVALRARCMWVGGEDAATGSAAGCTAAWLARYGVFKPEQQVHIRQGVEMQRTSDIFVRASRDGERITNVRVGGYASKAMEGRLIL
jgi:trans-2,3-dihydro-3-hydroxyanthranilate isomerase